MTHRQYVAWQAWLRLQWNVPDLTCNYLMQIATEVRRTIAKDPNGVRMSEFRLEFRDVAGKAELPPDDKVRSSKAGWFAATGIQ